VKPVSTPAPERLSPEREAEIAARVDAAHPGPWRRSDDEGSLERYVISEDDLFAVSFGYRGNSTQAEADFIAHARADVPALLAELAAVRAELTEAIGVTEGLNRRLSEEMLAGSGLYAALTMPTTPEQLQAALDEFTAVAKRTAAPEGGTR
jgi:hypothetical protein